jgi:hypothetical protein
MGVSWVFLTTFPAKRLVFQIEVDHIALDQEIGLISYSNGFGFMDFSWQWPFQCQKNMDFPLRRMMEQLKLEKASRVVKSTGDGEVHGFRGIDIGETLGPSKIQI